MCFGEKNGSIDLTVSVGVQPFTYKWQPTQAGDPQDLMDIGAGTYAVTVTDAVGCTGTASFNILQPAAALALSCGMTKVVTQPGATNGEAEVVITGGTAPFTVSLSPGGPAQVGVPAGTLTFPNLGVGSYSTTVTDANGCSAVCTRMPSTSSGSWPRSIHSGQPLTSASRRVLATGSLLDERSHGSVIEPQRLCVLHEVPVVERADGK